MTDRQARARIYQSELNLKAHVQNLEGEQKQALESIVTDLRDLRKEMRPEAYFGELE